MRAAQEQSALANEQRSAIELQLRSKVMDATSIKWARVHAPPVLPSTLYSTCSPRTDIPNRKLPNLLCCIILIVPKHTL